MEKVLLFEMKDDQIAAELAANMRIRLERIPKEQYGQLLHHLVKGTLDMSVLPYEGEPLGGSMVVFCDLTEKHLDRFLFGLRTRGAAIRHKAVLTKTNRGWTPLVLYRELERERAAYEASAEQKG